MTSLALLTTLAVSAMFGQDENVTFRSDVALVRVDVQVLDRNNRAVTGLTVKDFVLREQGKVREIRNFASEDMPLDVLLLLDVSGSMRTHVERIAAAAHQAFQALGREDRVAIMVFDRRTRVRMPFRLNKAGEVSRELDRLLNEESFNGGTDIPTSLYSAIDYVKRQARKDARRAIVVMTDDQTEVTNNVWERPRSDVDRLVTALDQGDIVLSVLLADSNYGHRGGGGFPGGGGYPGGGGGGSRGPWGGIPGGIGFPRGGGGYPGGGGGGGPRIGGHGTRPAQTGQIAEQSGGDRMNVNNASALEDTLTRLRQRYALHFNLPEGARVGQQRSVVVDLASAARRRYPDADLRYRGNYMSHDSNTSTPAEVTGTSSDQQAPSSSEPQQQRPRTRRVSDPGSGATAGPMIDRDPQEPAAPVQQQQTQPATAPPVGGWPKNESGTTTQTKAADPAKPGPPKGGWPRVK